MPLSHRGPSLSYCSVQNTFGLLWLTGMGVHSPVEERYDATLLDGVEVLTVHGKRLESEGQGQYYTATRPQEEDDQKLTMIPYYAWCNRSEGQMQVWTRETN